MAIVISDIHGDIKKARIFLEYRPDIEHVILGDLVDSFNFGSTLQKELECLDLILRSNSTLLWGNHDLAYTDKPCWPPYSRLPDSLNPISDMIIPHVGRFRVAHAVDGWLCTHAGVSTLLTKNLPGLPMSSCDPVCITDWLNDEFMQQRKLPRPQTGQHQYYGVGPLFAIDGSRGGDDKYGGIFWYDHQRELAKPDPQVKQLFGHTHVAGPLKHDFWANINIEDGLVLYGFDTELNDFVILGRPQGI